MRIPLKNEDADANEEKKKKLLMRMSDDKILEHADAEYFFVYLVHIYI